jgi:hypothetical protein
VLNVLSGPNFHEVVPGALYRTSQPSPERLTRLVHQYGIRTIVNLRGVSEPAPWYLDECRTTGTLDVSQEDLPFSATRLPAVPALHRLVEVIDRSEYPILFHCNRGIDRTGMAVAVALLLHTDATVAQALRQLGPRHGHLAIGRTGHIDQFFELYEQWLGQQRRQHSRELFREWIAHHYCPGECRCRLALLDPEVLGNVRAGASTVVHLRATNASIKPWQFLTGNNAGIKCQAAIGLPNHEPEWQELVGMFEAIVPPGASIDLTVPLPAVPRAGHYRLRIDLFDPQHAFFHHLGGEPLFFDLEVQ